MADATKQSCNDRKPAGRDATPQEDRKHRRVEHRSEKRCRWQAAFVDLSGVEQVFSTVQERVTAQRGIQEPEQVSQKADNQPG
jgi:hypothetical protein